MIEYHIHDHLQTFGMSLITKLSIVIIRTETRIYAIIVRGSIAMIGRETVLLIRGVVLEDRSKPKGRNSQFLKVVEVLSDSVKVTTMTERRLRAILGISPHTLDLRIMPSPLGKAVGHQHVKHIGIGESHTLVTAHLTRLELVLSFCLAKLEGHHARLGIL